MATKLEAVNEILEAIGEPPATALDTAGTSEVAEAERFLDRENIRIQGEGWHTNTVDKTYTAASNEVNLGSSVLKIQPIEGDAWRNLTIRNAKLYDLDNNTAVFTTGTTVRLRVTELITFIQLLPRLTDYIIKSAAQRFQRYKKRGNLDEAILRDDLTHARVRAIQEDTDLARTNVLGTNDALRLRGMRNDSLTRTLEE